MTTAVAPVGLTFKGVDLQPADMQWFFEIERGLDEVPTVRGKDTIIPGLAGRFEQNRRNDTLSIVLKGWVRADPTITDLDDARASYRQNMLTIRTLFAPDAVRGELVALVEDGTSQEIMARAMNIIGGRYIASEMRVLSIELEGYDDWAEVAGS